METKKHKGIATHTSSVGTATTEKIRNKKHLQECLCTVDVNVNRNAAIIGNGMGRLIKLAMELSNDPAAHHGVFICNLGISVCSSTTRNLS